MKLFILFTSILYFTLCPSFSQTKKDVKFANKLVGSWKFIEAFVDDKIHINEFHTDTIIFKENHTFYFRSSDSDHTDVRQNSGNWRIENKGSRLVWFNRSVDPPFEEMVPDLFFPIKFISKKKIKIYYTLFLKSLNGTITSSEMENNTAVIFMRINK